jgi:hypothetical protein
MAPRSRSLTIKMEGLRRTMQQLKLVPQQVIPAVGAAMWQEANGIASIADLMVPYDTGALARSQIVHPPTQYKDRVFVEISYGGPAAPYAVVQHENLEFSHPSKASGLPPNGRQAKYLEEPFEDRVTDPQFEEEVGMRVEAAILRALIAQEGAGGPS